MFGNAILVSRYSEILLINISLSIVIRQRDDEVQEQDNRLSLNIQHQ